MQRSNWLHHLLINRLRLRLHHSTQAPGKLGNRKEFLSSFAAWGFMALMLMALGYHLRWGLENILRTGLDHLVSANDSSTRVEIERDVMPDGTIHLYERAGMLAASRYVGTIDSSSTTVNRLGAGNHPLGLAATLDEVENANSPTDWTDWFKAQDQQTRVKVGMNPKEQFKS